MTTTITSEPRPRVQWLGALLVCAAAACGGAGGKAGGTTTPTTPAAAGDGQSMNDPGDPDGSGVTSGGGGGTGAGTPGSGGTGPGGGPAGGPGGTPAPGGGGTVVDNTPPVVPLNLDPDPQQARAQVEQHLAVARTALAQTPPDGDLALKEARFALQIDAASVDAAAMVAFAYYHKKLYDTAELVLDDLYRREAAKTNPYVNYVYGLIYDRTNRPERAVLAYKEAVKANPNFASALINLGVHQLRNSQYAEAQQTFEKLVKELNRTDAVTLTSLGSAYRGRTADYPVGAPDREQLVRAAEASYRRALQANASYGPAYYNLGLLYLDNDPFPGVADSVVRLNTAKSYFEQYKNMPGVDIKLYDTRMKDVTKAIKRAEKKKKGP